VYVTNESDGTLTVIDWPAGEVVRQIPVGSAPHQLDVSPDGKRLFIPLNGEHRVVVLNAVTFEVEGTVPVGRRPHIVRVLPGAQTVLATSEGDQQVTIFDADSLEVVRTVPVFATPRVPAAASDGSKIYQTIRWLNGMLVIDTETGRVTGRIALSHERFAPEGKDAHGVGVHPLQGDVWLTSQTWNTVTIIDTATGDGRATISVGKDPNWIEFTGDGSTAAVSNTGDGTLSIIDVATHRVIGTVAVGPSPKRLAVLGGGTQ
jgi:YVTN family beta-propeller protein